MTRRAIARSQARWPDAGFLTTSDHLSNTTVDGGLETHQARVRVRVRVRVTVTVRIRVRVRVGIRVGVGVRVR